MAPPDKITDLHLMQDTLTEQYHRWYKENHHPLDIDVDLNLSADLYLPPNALIDAGHENVKITGPYGSTYCQLPAVTMQLLARSGWLLLPKNESIVSLPKPIVFFNSWAPAAELHGAYIDDEGHLKLNILGLETAFGYHLDLPDEPGGRFLAPLGIDTIPGRVNLFGLFYSLPGLAKNPPPPAKGIHNNLPTVDVAQKLIRGGQFGLDLKINQPFITVVDATDPLFSRWQLHLDPRKPETISLRGELQNPSWEASLKTVKLSGYNDPAELWQRVAHRMTTIQFRGPDGNIQQYDLHKPFTHPLMLGKKAIPQDHHDWINYIYENGYFTKGGDILVEKAGDYPEIRIIRGDGNPFFKDRRATFSLNLQSDLHLLAIQTPMPEARWIGLPLSLNNFDLLVHSNNINPFNLDLRALELHAEANGSIGLDGHIYVPEMTIGDVKIPELRLMRLGPTDIHANNFGLDYNRGQLTTRGGLAARWHLGDLQLGNQIVENETWGHFNLAATPSDLFADIMLGTRLGPAAFPLATAELDGQAFATLKTLLTPTYQSLQGTLGADLSLRAQFLGVDLAATGNFDLAGNVVAANGRTNFQGLLSSDDLLVHGGVNTLAANGHFLVEASDTLIDVAGTPQDFDVFATTSLYADVEAATPEASGNLTYAGDLVIETEKVVNPVPGSAIRQAHVSLTSRHLAADLELPGNIHITGELEDGKALPGFPPGLKATFDLNQLGLGLAAEATVNVELHEARITFPVDGEEKQFIISGQLVGRIKLLNISRDPQKPILRPLASSLNLEVLNAKLWQIASPMTAMIPQGRLTIADQGGGKIKISALLDTLLPANLNPIEIMALEVQIPQQFVKTFSPDVRDDADIVVIGAEEKTSCGITHTYYDVPLIDSAVATLEARIGQIVAKAKATISKDDVTYDGRVDFGRHRFALPENQGTISIRDGGLDVGGNKNALDVDIELPKTITYAIKRELANGFIIEISGTLHPHAKIPATINFAGKSARIGKYRPLRISGNLTATITHKKSQKKGQVVRRIPLKINMPAKLNVTAKLTGKQAAHIDFDIAELALEATLDDTIDITNKSLGTIHLAKGSTVKLPFSGFRGGLDLALVGGKLRMGSRFTPPQIGLALELTDSPLEKLAIISLPGTLKLDITHSFNKQKVDLDGHPGRLVAKAVPPTKVAHTKINLTLGENIQIGLDLDTKNEKFVVTYLPQLDQLVIDSQNLALSANASGDIKLSGFNLDLDPITAQAKILRLTHTIDLKGDNSLLTLISPDGHPAKDPPMDFASWMQWTAADWQAHRDDLNAREHFLVLSAEVATIPGLDFIPKGLGRVYIDLKDNLLTFNPDNPPPQEELLAHLIIRREFPNPPIPKGYEPHQTLIYNRGQDALFVLDKNDTQLIERVEKALDIPNNEARKMFQNGRFDLKTLLQNKWIATHLGEETLRNLAALYLGADAKPRHFAKTAHRFFILLDDLKTNLGGMVEFKAEYWSDKVRKVIPRDFSDEDTLDFRGQTPKVSDGVNMTTHAYLPFARETILGYLANPKSYAEWWPALEEVENDRGSPLRGIFEDGHNFNAHLFNKSIGNVDSVHLLPSRENADEESMPEFENEYILLPVRDAQGVTRGSVLVQQFAADFAGDDKDFYEGRNIDTNVMGRIGASLWEDGIPLLGHLGKQMLNPVRDPLSVAPMLLAQAVSNLNHLLLQDQEYNKEKASLTYTPDGLVMTSEPKEFLFIKEAVEGPQKFALNLKFEKEADKARIRDILTTCLGIDQTKADEWITKGEVTIDDLMKLTFLSEMFEAQTIISLAQVFLTNLHESLLSKGERFLLYLKDMRLHSHEWAEGTHAMHFRNFSESRFHRWSPQNNKDRADGTDSINYTIMPDTVSLDAIAGVLGQPEIFDDLTPDYAKSERSTDPATTPDRYNVDLTLMVAGKPAEARIEVPKEVQKIGNILYTPWWYAVRTNIPAHDQGFDENLGVWLFVPSKKGTIVSRLGLLNTKFSGDKDLSGEAAKKVAEFLENVFEEAARRDNKGGMEIEIKYKGVIE